MVQPPAPAGTQAAERNRQSRRRVLAAPLIALLTASVLGAGALPSSARASDSQAGNAAVSPDAAAPVLMVFGDSLSAGYGLASGEGWVALLGDRLAEAHRARELPAWELVNASISGETTSGGVSRLPALLKRHQPSVLVLELGGNDALRGLPLQLVNTNLCQMIKAAQDGGARVLLVGMQVPPNYGSAYARQFERLYEKIAKDTDSQLVPFLMAGFGDNPSWFQPDGIHPSAQAQPKMLDNVWPVLKEMLQP